MRGGKLGQELLMVRGVAGIRDFADARGEILPDAGNLTQAGLVQARQIVRMVRRRYRRRCGTRGS